MCFRRPYSGGPATQKPHGSSSPTVPSLGSLRPCLPQDTRNTPALPRPSRVLAAQDRSWLQEKCLKRTQLLNRGKAWEGSSEVTHNTTGGLFCFYKLKKNIKKQLTFFNVNVNCLLPTVVSDTLNVPFFASSFNRSSRVLLQEI